MNHPATPVPAPRSGKSRSAAGPDYPARMRAASEGIAGKASHFLVTNPIDVGYLTGFLGGDSYLLLGGARPLILSDFRYAEELEPLKPICDIFIRKGAMGEALGQVLTSAGCGQLAVQAEHVTLAHRNGIAKSVRGLKIVETVGILAGLRARKDDSEIALIRKAIRIQEEALEETLPQIKKALKKHGSILEIEIAAILEAAMKSRGSSEPGFESIIAARANGSFPHYRPQKVKLTPNQPLLVDWGAIYNGYHGDMTRVFCFGKWPKKIAEIYQIVLDAHELAASALAPGKTTKEIDALARDHIAKHGYGEHFGHGLGHGMGLDGHEDPRLSHMASATKLEPGHVVTIEPGIYLPGIGGVRIEDDFLITEKGAKNLCTLPKDIDWATR